MTPVVGRYLRDKKKTGQQRLHGGVLSGGPTGLSSGTFPLVTQFVVVLPQFGDKLSSLQLYLRVGGQVLRRRLFSDHSIGLDVQIPVDPENKNVFYSTVNHRR